MPTLEQGSDANLSRARMFRLYSPGPQAERQQRTRVQKMTRFPRHELFRRARLPYQARRRRCLSTPCSMRPSSPSCHQARAFSTTVRPRTATSTPTRLRAARLLSAALTANLFERVVWGLNISGGAHKRHNTIVCGPSSWISTFGSTIVEGEIGWGEQGVRIFYRS